MNSRQLIEKYFNYFEKRGHSLIPSSALVPENDSSVLFTTAGMHPLVPFLLGETHPEGKRLVDLQICLRTNDIDEVGDTSHHTFFEMLGNWSLGDYWKEESISWSLEFLTRELKLDQNRLWITCFGGDKDSSRDTESAQIWVNSGIAKEKIFFLPKEDNWWGPVGKTGPCGPDSEIFYDTSGKSHGSGCRPGDNCGRFFEIWNNVFMQYNKTQEGKYEPLSQKNVDTGMGVERTMAVILGVDDNYQVPDLWADILWEIEAVTKTKYEENNRAHRIIADHMRASIFIASEDIIPSNKDKGYVLRRLIRRMVRYGKSLGVSKPFLYKISQSAIKKYSDYYPRLTEKKEKILKVISEEELKFVSTFERGLREIVKIKTLDGKSAFYLFESYGFPVEITEEIARERGQNVDRERFEKEFEKHKRLSKSSSSGMFKGGLIDHSKEVTKLHTATHLLHAALRKVLGDQVVQKGSNITSERLRFDFSYDHKLTNEELTKVEDLVNKQIEKGLPVSFEIKSLTGALEEGALAFFRDKYTERVKVYTIGNSDGEWFSKEVCGGPHVQNTGEIGRVRIIKQEKLGADTLRIYLKLKVA